LFAPLRELDAGQLVHLTQVDHHDHEALYAIGLFERRRERDD
jgi:hypothetical protein